MDSGANRRYIGDVLYLFRHDDGFPVPACQQVSGSNALKGARVDANDSDNRVLSFNLERRPRSLHNIGNVQKTHDKEKKIENYVENGAEGETVHAPPWSSGELEIQRDCKKFGRDMQA
jgi:hypothetical protein